MNEEEWVDEEEEEKEEDYKLKDSLPLDVGTAFCIICICPWCAICTCCYKRNGAWWAKKEAEPDEEKEESSEDSEDS